MIELAPDPPMFTSLFPFLFRIDISNLGAISTELFKQGLMTGGRTLPHNTRKTDIKLVAYD